MIQRLHKMTLVKILAVVVVLFTIGFVRNYLNFTDAQETIGIFEQDIEELEHDMELINNNDPNYDGLDEATLTLKINMLTEGISAYEDLSNSNQRLARMFGYFAIGSFLMGSALFVSIKKKDKNNIGHEDGLYDEYYFEDYHEGEVREDYGYEETSNVIQDESIPWRTYLKQNRAVIITVTAVITVIVSALIYSAQPRSSDFEYALSNLDEQLEEYNVYEVTSKVYYEDKAFFMDGITEISEEYSRMIYYTVSEENGEVISSNHEILLLRPTGHALFKYVQHEMDPDIYYEYMEAPVYGNENDLLRLLADPNIYVQVKTDTYYTEFNYSTVRYSIEPYVRAFIEENGMTGFTFPIEGITIPVRVEINNREIDQIELDLSELYTRMLTYYNEIEEQQFIEVGVYAGMTIFPHQETVYIEEPQQIIEADLREDTPRLHFGSIEIKQLDFTYDLDVYELSISEAGTYIFDTDYDINLVLTVEHNIYKDMFSHENELYKEVAINERFLYLEPGIYIVTVQNVDTYHQVKNYRLSVAPIELPVDDYDYYKTFDDITTADVTDYTSITLNNDYGGDIEKLFIDVEAMKTAIVFVPYELELFQVDNGTIVSSMNTRDGRFYEIEAYDVSLDYWSISLLQDSEEGESTITFHDYETYQQKTYPKDTLTIYNEVIFMGNTNWHYNVSITTEGTYQLIVQRSKASANLIIDMYSSYQQTDYLTTFNNDFSQELHLESGTYYLYPRPTEASAVFSIEILRIN